MRRAPAVSAALVLLAAVQSPQGQPFSNAGARRAAASVDSVFVKHTATQAVVSGGDFGSYLMVRLGVVPIPQDFRLRVAVDSTRIELTGRVGDLPAQARDALGALLSMVPLATPIAGDIRLTRRAPNLVRFRLEAARVGGIPVPDAMLDAAFAQARRQTRGLGPIGRDVYLHIPPDADVELVTGGVRLTRLTTRQGG